MQFKGARTIQEVHVRFFEQIRRRYFRQEKTRHVRQVRFVLFVQKVSTRHCRNEPAYLTLFARYREAFKNRVGSSLDLKLSRRPSFQELASKNIISESIPEGK
jgi:hypothetical protein